MKTNNNKKNSKKMKPQQKKLTIPEKIELEQLVKKEIAYLKHTTKVMNEVETEHNEKLNEIIEKEIEIFETILKKLS